MKYTISYTDPADQELFGEPRLRGDESFETLGSIWGTIGEAVEAVLEWYGCESIEQFRRESGADGIEVGVIGRNIVIHVTED
jgi:Flp pilus assembly pilin Flp